MKKYDHNALIKAAIKSFWETKQKQLTASGDSSNRGAVVGGKQLDAFAELLKRLAIEQGVPEKCIYTSQAYLPGYFRSSKDWDFLIIAPNKKLIAAVPDFDSQKHPPLQPFEYPPVIKSEIFQGESLHFGYLCEHVYPQAQKQIGHGQRGRGGQEFGEVP